MEKRENKSTILFMLSAFLCVLIAALCFVAVDVFGASAEDEPSAPVAPRELVVLDKLEDFRVTPDAVAEGAEQTYSIWGTGTDRAPGKFLTRGEANKMSSTPIDPDLEARYYEALGNPPDNDPTLVKDSPEYIAAVEFYLEAFEYSMGDAADSDTVMYETGLSDVGMRKILGVDASDNCGLVKEDGESDEDYAERVSAALFRRVLSDEAYRKDIKIVIPANISKIGSCAFLSNDWVISGSNYNPKGFAGGDAALDKTKDELKDMVPDVDFDSAQSMEDIENIFIVYALEQDYGVDYDSATLQQKGEARIQTKMVLAFLGLGVSTPSLVELEFAKNEDGSRALLPTGLGYRIFGNCLVDELTIPKGITKGDAFMSMTFRSLVCEEGVTEVPSQIAFKNKSLKRVELPESVTKIGAKAFNQCPNLEFIDFSKSPDGVVMGSEAFSGLAENHVVRIRSLDQWMTFKVGEYANPISNKGKFYVKVDSADGLPPEDYVVDDDGSIWAWLKTLVISDDYTEITQFMFDGANFERVELGNNIKKIGKSAFRNSAMTSVNLAKVENIEVNAFTGSKLESVILPKTLKVLGTKSHESYTYNGAFSGCKSLRSVVFEEGSQIDYIGAASFRGCTKLGEPIVAGVENPIVIPKTVQRLYSGAFAGCGSLTSVRFEDGSQIKILGHQAFADCKQLKSIELPEGLTTVGMSCFERCESLSEVTLPESLNGKVDGAAPTGPAPSDMDKLDEKFVGLYESAFWACGNNTPASSPSDVGFTLYVKGDLEWITCDNVRPIFGGATAYRKNSVRMIFKDKATRDKFYTGSKSVKYGVMAQSYCDSVIKGGYITDLNGAPEGTTIEFLYNVEIDFFDKDGNKVAATQVYPYDYNVPSTIRLPKSADTWYSDNGTFVNAVTSENIVAALKGQNDALLSGDGKDKIKLYAKEFNGGFLPRTDIVYDGKSYAANTELNKLLSADSIQITDSMDVSITAFTAPDGTLAAENPIAVKDAGIYSIKIDTHIADLGNNGVVTFDLTVNKVAVDISSLDWHISKVGNDATALGLSSTRLYIYKSIADEDADPTVSLTPLDLTLPENSDLMLFSTTDAVNSVARYRGDDSAMVVSLVNGIIDGYGTVRYTGGNEQGVALGNGICTVEAVLTPSANSEFVVRSTAGFGARNIVMTDNGDGTVTVTKTIYVVVMNNWLVNDANGDYVFCGDGSFGSGIDFAVPRIMYGDVPNTSYGLAGDYVTLSLTHNGRNIGTFKRNDYQYYINDSMPAGDYVLTVSVGAVVFEGRNIPGMERLFEFTVESAQLSLDETLIHNTVVGYADYEWELTDNANKELFFKKFADTVGATGIIKTVTVEPQGYWATDDGKAYYGDYVVKYNFARMNNERYEKANNNYLYEYIAGGARGTYKVYFQIEMPNHAPLTASGSERYGYFFTVTVFETVEAPAVGNAVYTGNRVVPEISGADDSLFTTVWSDDDEYVNGGTHSLTFKLNDGVHYRWSGVRGDSVEVEFTVTKANNVFTQSLSMLGWRFETFDAAANGIRAGVRYLNDGEKIHFRVTKKGATTAEAGLDDFTVDAYGKTDAATAAKLNALATGKYTLYATVYGTDDYNEIEVNIDFEVSKAMNSWADGDEDLSLPSWIVGEYNAEENVIVVNAAHGTVNIVITDIDGNEYYNSVTGVNKLNECAVGKYLLKAWVDETDDFAALAERSFTIEVFEKVGMPWWATLLIALGALAVAAVIILILWKKGVFQIMTEKIVVAIRTRANVDATIAAVRAAKKEDEAKKTVAAAEAQERAEARRAAAKAEREKPAEERAAALEAKAQAQVERAEKMRLRAEALQARAARLRGAEQPTTEEPTEEAAATEETPTDE